MHRKLVTLIRPVANPGSAARWFAIAALLGISLSPHALAFNSDATEFCLAQAEEHSPSRSSFAVLECVGQSALACMRQPGKDNTLGMMECLDGEDRYWETRLSLALMKARTDAEQADADTPLYDPEPPSLLAQLNVLQVAWEAYRNAACLYEQAQWRGGSGAGPVTAACYMRETARQTLKLEGWWSQ